MAAKWTKNPPPWFNAADYQETSKLDARGWASMLWVRKVYRILLKTREDWNSYLEDVQFSNPLLPVGGDLPSSLGLPRDVLEDFTDAAMRDATILDYILNVQVGGLGHRLLTIDPKAPDATLKRAFEKWIAKMRASLPASFRNRGPRSLSSKISPSILAGWSRYQVLAVMDLDFYAEVFHVSPLSHEALFSLLGPTAGSLNEATAKEWGRSARKAAEDAFAATDALVTQVRVG